MKKRFNSIVLRDILLIAVFSAALVFGMTKYVTPVEKARDAALKALSEYSIETYLEEDRQNVNDFFESYEQIIKNCTTVIDVEKARASFEKKLDKKFKTKDAVITSYEKKLNGQVKNIYSEEDNKKAKKLVADFKKKASEKESRNDIDLTYTTYKSKIGAFKTIKQHEKEEAEKAYLHGTWQKLNSNEYPFALHPSGSFYMPIEKESVSFKNGKIVRENKTGNLGGTWELTEYDQVVISISYSTLNEDYEPYTWIFDYNKADKTLEGTGDFAGWVYNKVSDV